MSEIKQFRSRPAVCLVIAIVAGAACAKWIPSNWFLTLLGYSMLIALILASLATLNLKDERRPPVAISLLLEALWLPARNADMNFGLILWAFIIVAGFVAGMLICAIILPTFT
jgi:uncharacterized membrane protein YfcA